MYLLSRAIYLQSGVFRSTGRVLRNMTHDASAMKLVWIDMEMTGLEIEHDKVLEVACLLTDINLRKTIEGPHVVIHQPESTLVNMDPWCVEQHTKTGLVEQCKRSQVTENDAETLLMDFLMKHIPKKEGVLAGNTVYIDRRFLKKYLPKVDDYLHYRIVDVSSVKELCRGWFPDEHSNIPPKQLKHRALEDIMESIEELRYYKKSIFKQIVHNNIK